MPRTASPASLTDRIQSLVSQRQQHADAITAIDQTLGQISSLLGVRKPGRPSSVAPSAISPAVIAPKRGRRRRRSFATTGLESVLAFVRERGNPTTKEINAHWKQEGRGGTADSLLGSLVKDGMLKRKPLGGKMGSEYSLTSGGATAAAKSQAGGKRRGRGGYAITAEQMVLDFVNQKGNPTTQDIKKLWEKEGRKGRPDNQLSLLVQAKKLKRTPIPGERGSRYSIA